MNFSLIRLTLKATALAALSLSAHAQTAGLSAVVCGPGDMAQGHRPDEYIEAAQLAACDTALDAALARFIAPKGAIALNGVSLTVNEVAGCDFGVNLIPHTRAVTNLGHAAAGGRLNVEVDTMARYVARLAEWA